MKPRVLVVDDSVSNRTLLTDRLEADGYEVMEASNGVEALTRVDDFTPDLVLLDVMMPKLDGYETLRILKSREKTRYIPVLMLTARAELEDKVTGLELGADDYIVKPFSPVEISLRVRSVLRLREYQRRLSERDQLSALGQVALGMAHEIRNPLVTVGGLARRLYALEPEGGHGKEYAEPILRAVERMERMLRRIDEYGAILSSRFGPGDVNSVVVEALKDMGEATDGKSIEIRTTLMLSPPVFELDAAHLKLAIINLVQNAIDAIEDSGNISIETSSTDTGDMVVRITDTGCGMTRKDLTRIFNPFQTSKTTGAGLGLTLTSRIVYEHGGTIDVDSKKGRGTAFTIKLPVSGAATDR